MDATQTLQRPVIKPSRIILPTEHGSWAFLAEPLIAGLAISYSSAGPWIGLMAIAAFLARQPLKTYFLARHDPALASSALRFSLLFGAAALAALIVSIWLEGALILYPAAAAALLAAVQFRFDILRMGRSLWAEVIGAAALSSSAAMISLAGGRGWTFAAGMWAVFAMRSVPSILYVRNRLLLEKGKSFDRVQPIAAHAIALAGLLGLAAFGLASLLTAGMFAFLLVRCIIGLSERRTRMKAMKIGVWEVVYGALTLLSIIAGYYAGI